MLVGIGAGFAVAFQFWPVEPGGTGAARGLLELLKLFVATFGKVGAGVTVFALFLIIAITVWLKGSVRRLRHNSTDLNPVAVLRSEGDVHPPALDQLQRHRKAEPAVAAPMAKVK